MLEARMVQRLISSKAVREDIEYSLEGNTVLESWLVLKSAFKWWVQALAAEYVRKQGNVSRRGNLATQATT